MSLISSIAKSFNFKLPDLSGIKGKNLVDTVKNLAKVAGDTFLKPSTDGKGIFQSEVNVLGMRLPNPVEILAQKLLGKAGEKVREMGFSPEAIATIFGGGRNIKDVPGETTLPPLNERVKELAPQKTQTGGGTKKTTKTTTPKAESTTQKAPAQKKETGGSSKAVSSTGHDFAEEAINKFGGKLDALEGEIEKFMNGSGELEPTALARMQAKIQKRNELFQMLSQILQMEHETKKGIIQNIR